LPTGGGGGISIATDLRVNSLGVGVPAPVTTGNIQVLGGALINSDGTGQLRIQGGNGYLGAFSILYGVDRLMLANTDTGAAGSVFMPGQAFSALPAAAAGNAGNIACVSDSTTKTPGDTITGGAGFKVLAFSNGTNWIVAAG
jgi:hypothetical protein